MLKSVLMFVLATTVTCGGCVGMAGPNWYCPGTAKVQQLRAEQFDPYPEVVSRSEMVGARPRQYDRPAFKRDEPRSPWYQNPWVPMSQPTSYPPVVQ